MLLARDNNITANITEKIQQINQLSNLYYLFIIAFSSYKNKKIESGKTQK